MKLRSRAIAFCTVLFTALPVVAHDTPSYMRLTEKLDRPEDGYCLDVLGAGGSFRPDMPLISHNCKPGRAPDGMVTLRKDGSLYFPAFDACVTVMGVNRKALAGSALMLKACNAEEAFLRAAHFQGFSHRPDGRLALNGSDLCVTVGADSAPTFSSEHAWRTLFMMSCAQAPEERSRWSFQSPANQP